MKITSINLQARDKNRVNVSVDGKYRFSLDIAQIGDVGIKVGNEYTEEEIVSIENESSFGKLYLRALEYCLIRYRSMREVKDYLNRKTRPTIDKKGNRKPGYTIEVTERVFDRLLEKGHINDQRFADYWVNNRSLKKGVSRRKLTQELMKKGVSKEIINQSLGNTDRSDNEEIVKIIIKKQSKYADEQKLIGYLIRQGFDYDDVKNAIANIDSDI